ncbi:MAG: sigma-70 family RNA polymerase sigma factor, partial [Muribaculaceae bacterium]|nr:sigma-70 family RNA polymerase sigma factor [Muribaculaceae bacterium]
MQYSITEFEEIYRRCCRSALKLAFSLLHDDDEARDAVQEVFLKLWESDSVIENEGAYILRMVRNSCLNRIAATDIRERLKRKLSLDDIDETEEPRISGDKLKQAVTTLLSPRERQVVDKIY